MSTETFLRFYDSPNGPVELADCHLGMDNRRFEQQFPGIKGRKFDSFAKLVSPRKGDNFDWNTVLPVTRVIRYKKNPSLHVCNAKCMGGKPSGVCECSCGGKNHGISSL